MNNDLRACIDIGSNSILLFIANTENQQLKVLQQMNFIGLDQSQQNEISLIKANQLLELGHTKEAAATFLNWVGSSEFATIFANALPGFFPLSSAPVTLEDPLAQEIISWRGECESTIRSTYQVLSRGTPNLENDTWNASVAVIKGEESPEDAGKRLQDGLASWYAPQQ